MTPQGQGRFCQSCSKTVIDFTVMSNAEIVQWFSKAEGRTCGRFKDRQLDKLLVSSPIRQSYTWKAITFGLSAWLSTRTAEAKVVTTPTMEQVTLSSTIQSFDLNKTISVSKQDSALLKGAVLDLTTKEGLPGVTVQIKGTTTATATDKKGHFTLSIPNNVSLNTGVIVFYYVGYKTEERNIGDVLKKDFLLLALEPATHWLGEVSVTSYYRWYTPRGAYDRLRNLFR
ncbi:hypothetical protein GU926_13035 [Nibribacter ruber]|uniref:Carboxypeptidase-like regulatory domain-containing protein n=1 Tax=Nibribacter ruber TaxID=2698458 RepID=A0A6P1NWR8_9BACT|nr:carboxypeptidase-like regulatory domain-containing protein [Nibribacter ruber]QHL88306.1 hypothetical protein GU926_13035 [Nibribacter ruber]